MTEELYKRLQRLISKGLWDAGQDSLEASDCYVALVNEWFKDYPYDCIETRGEQP